MKIFLMIVGGIVVGFLVLVLVLWVAVKLFFRRLGKSFAEAIKAAGQMGTFTQPMRIHIQPAEELEWEDRKTIDELARQLKTLGFEDVGLFTIDEMGGFRLRTFAHEPKSVYAAIYEHAQVGVILDLATKFEDGTDMTYTTAPESGLEQFPGSTKKRYAKQTPVAEIFNELLADRPDKPLRPATVQAFVEQFEVAYAEEMDWRAKRGFSEQEIRNVARIAGQEELDDATIEMIRASYRSHFNSFYEEQLRERFLEKSNLSAAKWDKYQHRIVFVHDNLSIEDLEGHYSGALDWNDEDAAQKAQEEAKKVLSAGNPRQVFAKVIEALPPERAFKKLGSLSTPIGADVYLAPQNHEKDDE